MEHFHVSMCAQNSNEDARQDNARPISFFCICPAWRMQCGERTDWDLCIVGAKSNRQMSKGITGHRAPETSIALTSYAFNFLSRSWPEKQYNLHPQ